MEQKKIGEFIAAQRKEKRMTQEQLGETLGISDKTVSKWECGNGLPDISVIMPLCGLLGINVNELLSGERLTQDTYSGKAEENMMNLMRDNGNQKKEMGKMVVAGIGWILGIAIFLGLLFGITEYDVPVYYFIDMYGMLEVLFIMFFSLCFAGHLKDFGNAFAFLFHEAESREELENSITAVSLAEKALVCGGAFCSFFIFAKDTAVTLITLFYGLFGVVILAPIKSRLGRKKRNGVKIN